MTQSNTPHAPAQPRVGMRRVPWIVVACLLLLLGGVWTFSSHRTQPDKPNPVSAQQVTPNFTTIEGKIINQIDGAEVVAIPAGVFLMGSANDTGASDDEKPQHKVNLDAYYMYKNDMTVAQYRMFCAATWHSMPEAPSWGWIEDHPVVNVSWDDAKAYADWAGAALPTEAQWEKAARGTDGRIYPWGNVWDAVKCNNAVGGNMYKTSPVGNYPAGASPYGCMDMAGNVWQWCADWYGNDYYTYSPSRNPNGPVSGNSRVLRGGSWDNDDPRYCRAAYRGDYDPTLRYDVYGFRCASRSSGP